MVHVCWVLFMPYVVVRIYCLHMGGQKDGRVVGPDHEPEISSVPVPQHNPGMYGGFDIMLGAEACEECTDDSETDGGEIEIQFGNPEIYDLNSEITVGKSGKNLINLDYGKHIICMILGLLFTIGSTIPKFAHGVYSNAFL